MRAQQVTDLNAARNKIAEIVPLLEKIQTKLGMNGSKGLYNNAQIHLSIENGLLKIFGAQQLIADGYVPYLFRHTRSATNGMIKSLLTMERHRRNTATSARVGIYMDLYIR